MCIAGNMMPFDDLTMKAVIQLTCSYTSRHRELEDKI